MLTLNWYEVIFSHCYLTVAVKVDACLLTFSLSLYLFRTHRIYVFVYEFLVLCSLSLFVVVVHSINFLLLNWQEVQFCSITQLISMLCSICSSWLLFLLEGWGRFVFEKLSLTVLLHFHFYTFVLEKVFCRFF